MRTKAWAASFDGAVFKESSRQLESSQVNVWPKEDTALWCSKTLLFGARCRMQARRRMQAHVLPQLASEHPRSVSALGEKVKSLLWGGSPAPPS